MNQINLESIFVVKKDNKREKYDRVKLLTSLAKVAEQFGIVKELLERIVGAVEQGIMAKFGAEENRISTADIKDIVVLELSKLDDKRVLESYISTGLNKKKSLNTESVSVDVNKTIESYLVKSDWRVYENANSFHSVGGLILNNSGALVANYWLHEIYSPEIRKAHINTDFHIHDLGMFSGYCAGWSLKQLIERGLEGPAGQAHAKPAKHFSTVIGQMVNFLGILQNEWAGAQAFSSFDTYLAPFIRRDNLTYLEVKQAIQSFVFGINVPSRWGNQTPFINITLDWVVPEDLKDKNAVVGGEYLETKYSDYQKEMDMINKAFLEVMIEGDSQGKIFEFPIPTYNITRDFDWDSPNAELLFTMTAKYGNPYFQNFINSDLNPGDVRSMCCRLRLDKRELRKRSGGLFGADELTGSVGVVTINLPKIGYLSKTKEEYFNRLERLIELASESLVTKRKVVSEWLNRGFFPYSRRYLGNNFNNHFSTIGIIGMNESLLNFMDTNVASEEGRKFAAEVLDFMLDKISTLQVQTGDLYNLEATPGEGLSYRFAKHDKERYPGIIHSGTQEAPYYTNSTSLPVNYTNDIFEALDLQEELQCKYTGGTVVHVFLGEAIEDWRSCRELVKAIANNYKIPYFTMTPTFSICEVHGYLNGEHFNCYKCANEERLKIKAEIKTLQKEKEKLEKYIMSDEQDKGGI